MLCGDEKGTGMGGGRAPGPPPPPAGRAGLAPLGAGSAPPDPRGLSLGGGSHLLWLSAPRGRPSRRCKSPAGFRPLSGSFRASLRWGSKNSERGKAAGLGPPPPAPLSCISWGRGVWAGGLHPTFHRADKSLEVFVEFVAFVLQIKCIGGGDRTSAPHGQGRWGPKAHWGQVQEAVGTGTARGGPVPPAPPRSPPLPGATCCSWKL